ncbi:MAG: HlyD family efflux transporter periplasmic adaptor subunit [Magnetococcales bacterium]|nr:HlyD family efflux transporter periplasmic adaptor subunit [Magnetococcales bacterium]
MQTSRRFYLPLLVIIISVAVGVTLLKTGPAPKRKQAKPVITTVTTITAKPTSFTVWISSQGLITPYLRSAVTSEAAGRLVEVAPKFIQGAFFEKGDLLARIDPESYRLFAINLEASIKIVKARLEELQTLRINKQKQLKIENQLLNLADRQFKRLSILKKAGTVTESTVEQGERELLSRRSAVLNLKNGLDLIPAQRHNLEAELQLKQAQRDTALLDLKRTEIIAPFTGRVVKKQADLGQFVGKGQTLGEIYSTAQWEVRLPISSQDLSLLDLSAIKKENIGVSFGPKVKLTTSGQGSINHHWSGDIVRMESVVDSHTRQVILVARINSSDQGERLDYDFLDGLFVEAAIQGRTLHNVFVLPRHTAGPGDRVLLIDNESRLLRKKVDIPFRNAKSIVISGGIKAMDRISLTPLPYTPDGAIITVQQNKTNDKKPQDLADKGER